MEQDNRETFGSRWLFSASKFHRFGIVLFYIHKKGVTSSVTVVIFPLLEGERDSQRRNQTSLVKRNKFLNNSLRSSPTSPPSFQISILSGFALEEFHLSYDFLWGKAIPLGKEKGIATSIFEDYILFIDFWEHTLLKEFLSKLYLCDISPCRKCDSVCTV